MAEKATIARPYGKAAFAHAAGKKDFERWSRLLERAKTIVSDPRVRVLLSSPSVTPQDLTSLIADICSGLADEDGLNFVRTLADNRRLALLPEIAGIYEEMRADAENIADVQLTSAVALDTAQRERLAAALHKRLKREIRLHCDVDAGLIGGAIVRSADLVIDGSLRAQLERLAIEMTR